MPTTETPLGFDALNLSTTALETIKNLGITIPTPIQAQAIPVALEGKDIFGIAQTGTGKTLAFALPIAERLMPGEQALILAPTRELAEQIDDTFRDLGFRTALLIGGANMQKQIMMLKRRPPIVVGTPGRVMDHIMQRTWRIGSLNSVVLDEADRMLDIGFAPIIRRILGSLPAERQTMLFSATLSDDIEELAKNFMNDPVRVEVAPQGSTAELVQQELVCVQHEQKHDVLKNLLYDHTGTVLVFARTRHGARKVAQFVRDLGHTATEIHSDRTLGQRRDALYGFKTGRFRVLVATDVAARGIDVKDISVVINFDIPEHAEDYVHRIGRTGRAGAEGLAITFTMPHQWKEVRDIEKLIQKEIPESQYSVERVKRQGSNAGPSQKRNDSCQRRDRGPRQQRSNQDRPYQDRTRQDRPVQDQSNQDRPYQDRPQQERSYQDRPAQDRPYQDRPNQDRPYSREGADRRNRPQPRNENTRPYDRPVNRPYESRSERPVDRSRDEQPRQDVNSQNSDSSARAPKRSFRKPSGPSQSNAKRIVKPYGQKFNGPKPESAPRTNTDGSKNKFSDQFGGMPRPGDNKPKRRR